MLERLEKMYGRNNPIFLEEIFMAFPEYSRPTVYRLLSFYVEEGTLSKFGKGIYYLPKETSFGQASPSLERVIERKYVRDGERVYGIYGNLSLLGRFGISTQIPNAIEVITNNASRAVREVEMMGRRVIIRKARASINNENVDAYTLLELFSSIDMKEYGGTAERLVKEYIEEKKVTRIAIMSLADSFPSRAMKNLVLSEAVYLLI